MSEIGQFRGKRVQLTRSDGQKYNTSVVAVRGDTLEIVEPRDWVIQPGEQLTIAIVPPFGMRQNAEALAKFRAGEVEGSWDDLARLLCRPQDLVLLSQLSPPSTFYCDDDPETPSLNDEQRLAVTGAVSTPHAYLVQGPPGTGKTEVICETVRQLVGRGERVLLLAPTHVAVDEVLSRVGHKPGLRPLRITWSDDQVADKLHAFLPANVGIELAARIARPADHGQVARWERERDTIDARLTELAQMDDVLRRYDGAVIALRAAAQEATDTAGRLHTRQAATGAEIAALERGLTVARDVLAEATTAADDAVRADEAIRTQVVPLLTALRDAANEHARSTQALVEASHAARSAESSLRAWSVDHNAQLRHAEAGRDAVERAGIDLRRSTMLAAERLAKAHEALEQAQRRQRGFGHVAEQLGLGEVAKWRGEVRRAEQEVAEGNTALAERRNQWRATAAWLDRLTDQGARRRATLQSIVESRAATLRDAEQRYGQARHEFDRALTAVGTDTNRVPANAEPKTILQVSHSLRDYLDQCLAGHGPNSWTGLRALMLQRHLPGAADVIREYLERTSLAAATRARLERQRAEAAHSQDEQATKLEQARIWAGAEIERLTTDSDAAKAAITAARAELDAITDERNALAQRLGVTEPAAEAEQLRRRRRVLDALPALDARWRALVAERTDDQFADDIRHSLIRATNLVCATTKGIVGKGSRIVRHTDYDTLIVDEASRVTESEFLIGAVKARRWVLVGDEKQLPPYVDQVDEHFLHALIALNRTHRGESETLEEAVGHLADIWEEDEKERRYRQESVQQTATDLDSSGQWRSIFRAQFAEAYEHFTNARHDNGDSDQSLLRAMRRYLVQSLFERAAPSCRVELRQPLKWQRRMIAPLASIVDGPIYGGRYLSPSNEQLATAGVTPLVLSSIFERPATFLDTSHYDDAIESEYKRGFVNIREQEWIIRTCKIFNAAVREPITVSVLAFYRAQARALERRLLPMKLPMLQWEVIDVIDKIQGQQSDLVILSFTRASPTKIGENYGRWLQDLRRLNVACSRARRAVVLVGHSKTLRRLRATKQAAAFYANLFDLFDTDENFQLIRRFG